MATSRFPGGGSGGGSVDTVTGLNTNNADPANPVVGISVDGTTVTGAGTPGSPLVSHGGSGSVLSVTGLNTNNTDPTNPVVGISVDGTSVTGLGTPGSPLVAQFSDPPVNDGNSGTTKTIDWSGGSTHYLTLTGNVTLTFTNPVDGGKYVLLIATGAGGFSVTYPGTVLWPGGTGPTSTATASKQDLITFLYKTGVGFIGSFNQNY